MMIIDLPSLGAKTFHKLKENKSHLKVEPRKEPSFEDLFQISLLKTDLVFGNVLLPIAATAYQPATMQESLLLFHPVHGLWLAFFNDSSEPVPHIGVGELDGFLQAWESVEEELLWDEIPMRALLIFKNLEEGRCVAEFEHAPFPVFYKDTADTIVTRITSDLSLTNPDDGEATIDLNAISALGALSVVAEIRLENLRPLGCHVEQLVELGKSVMAHEKIHLHAT